MLINYLSLYVRNSVSLNALILAFGYYSPVGQCYLFEKLFERKRTTPYLHFIILL